MIIIRCGRGEIIIEHNGASGARAAMKISGEISRTRRRVFLNGDLFVARRVAHFVLTNI